MGKKPDYQQIKALIDRAYGIDGKLLDHKNDKGRTATASFPITEERL